MNFLLKNISWNNEHEQIRSDVRIKNGIIAEIGEDLISKRKETPLNCENYFLYPGLINSHDHLEMNLYPLMGNPPYHNYTEWAKDIYRPKESPIKEIQSIDIKERLMWGGIKNLISGVTTVVHHNPWHRLLSKKKFPIRVIETAWAHSVAFEKNVHEKFSKKRPFVIHAGEGTDELAQNEIPKLDKLGALKSNTVLIHAIGVNEASIKLIEKAKSSVIWCPSSNLFMFNKTLPSMGVKEKIKVAIGSDSTMTGPATLLDEMRAARNSCEANSPEIFKMVTSIPARIFNLDLPQIKIGAPADFWIAPIHCEDYFENAFKVDSSNIRGVFVRGEFRYGDFDLAKRIDTKGFEIGVQNKSKWIAYDVRLLKKKIERKAREACLQNSLWKLLA